MYSFVNEQRAFVRSNSEMADEKVIQMKCTAHLLRGEKIEK